MVNSSELSYDQEIEKVVKVQFGLCSPEKIRNSSLVHVTLHETFNSSEPYKNGVLDVRMGVIDNAHHCPTCGQRNTFCPGHPGHIELCKPMFFTQFIDTCKKLTRCVCHACSTMLLFNPDEAARAKLRKHLMKLPGAKRFDYVYQLCTKNSKRDCPVCGERQANIVNREGVFKFILEWRGDADDGGTRTKVMMPEDVLDLFERITDDDAELLGFSAKNRPEWMICTVFPVLPSVARPSVHNEIGQRREDDLTHKLVEIVKNNKLLKSKIEANASQKEIEQIANVLQWHIATYADNNLPNIGLATQRNGRVMKSLSERLKAKEGRIRGNLMGKRVDFSARTVITGDPNISIDELGVPLSIAMNLTFPEIVTEFNKGRLQDMVNNGPNVYPGANFIRKLYPVGFTLRIDDDIPRASRVLVVGDVVDRHMLNGDWVLFNRQPSLHRMSMMAHRVRVMEFDTFRLNVCVTTCYNADYDGDEMNMHLPQSLQSMMELKMLANVTSQMISPRMSSPIISVVQDIALGIFMMTAPGVKVKAKTAVDILSVISNKDVVLPKGAKTITGTELMSSVIPAGVFIKNGPLEIKDGKIVSGQLSSKIYASSSDSNNLVQVIFRDMGQEVARKFLDDTQRLVCEWLCRAGFSVGIGDLAVEPHVYKQVRDVIAAKKAQMREFMNSVHNGTFNNDSIYDNEGFFEQRIVGFMREAEDTIMGTDELKPIIKFDPIANSLMSMVKGGSKGKSFNVQQMTALVGQQMVEGGKRVQYGYPGRTLPHFTKGDDSPEARGFVEHSFVEGLTPWEFFFHAMGGREGLIDTAVKTSDTGYIQRKLSKAMEDLMVAMDMSVRTAKGNVIQLLFGGDGFDPTRLEIQDFPTIMKTLPDIMEEFFIAEDELPVLRACMMDEAYAKLEKTKEAWTKRLLAYRERVIEDRRAFAINVSKGKKLAKVYFPVNMTRILSTVERQFLSSGPLPTDLTPDDILDAIEQLVEVLRPTKHQPENKMLGMMLRAYMNPKQMLMKGFNSYMLRDVCERITKMYREGLAHPGELVGIISAQSTGEPATQMTLNSCTGETELLLKVDGELVRTTIGDYVEAKIVAANKADAGGKVASPLGGKLVEQHPNDTTLAWLNFEGKKVEILACDENGRILWDEVEAVTRHPVVNKDGSNTLLKVTLHSGREVIATKGKSFLKRVDNKIVGVDGDALAVGDYLPVSSIFPVDGSLEFWDVARYLPKSEWVFTSEVKKGIEKSKESFWWKKYHGKEFTVPYNRSDSFLDAWRTKEMPESDCVYPKFPSKKETAHIPEQFRLDEEFGFFVGAYLSEGNCTKYNVMISNVDDAFNARLERYCDRIDLKYHYQETRDERGHSKTIRTHSYVLAQLFQKAMGRHSHAKRVPVEFFSAPDPFLKGLIDGYFSGDGCVAKSGKRVEARSCSKGLVEDMQTILLRFGISCSVRAQPSSLTHKKFANPRLMHLLALPKYSAKKFANTFDLTIGYKQERLDEFTYETDAYDEQDVIPDVKLVDYKVIENRFGKDAVRRNELSSIFASLTNEEDKKVIGTLMEENIFYDKVKSIEEVPNPTPYVYDLTTKCTKNFTLSTGLCVRDTFHSAGISSKSVQGVPRLAELLHASKTPKSPLMQIFLVPEAASSKERAQEVLNELETTRLRDIVRESAIYYDPLDSTTQIDEDNLFVESWRSFMDAVGCGPTAADTTYSPFVLRLIMNRMKLHETGLTMHDIYFALKREAGGDVSCIFSDDNFDKLVLRLRLPIKRQGSSLDLKQDIVQTESRLLDMIIKGVEGIRKVMKNKQTFSDTIIKDGDEARRKMASYDPMMDDFRSWEAWVLEADGTNLAKVLAHPLVDKVNTVTNDVQQILKVLGVEAARAAILEEIQKTMAGLFVQHRHLELLADVMVSRSSIMPINRHGINNSEASPLAKISFEETAERIFLAGIFGEVDNVSGISANVMLGQIPEAGTGLTKMIVDPAMLKQPYKEREKGANEDDIQNCGVGFEFIEFDFGKSQENYIPSDGNAKIRIIA